MQADDNSTEIFNHPLSSTQIVHESAQAGRRLFSVIEIVLSGDAFNLLQISNLCGSLDVLEMHCGILGLDEHCAKVVEQALGSREIVGSAHTQSSPPM